MKSPLRCILFALIALPAACGGEHSTSTTSIAETAPVPRITAASAAPDQAVPDQAAPAQAAPEALPTSYAAALAQGKALAASGDHAHARELFEAASRLDRKAAEPQLELSRLFIATGERGRAIAAASKAVKLAPGSSQAYNTLGRAELARWGYDAAVAAFRRATELNPDHVWAWNNLGYTELARKHYPEAIDALVEATRRPGAEGYMWNNLGTAYEQLGRLDDARAAFESGGKLGSREALASRTRLEGVKTVAVARDASKASRTTGYDLREDMPAAPPVEPDQASPDDAPDAADVTGAEPDSAAEAPGADAPEALRGDAPAGPGAGPGSDASRSEPR